MSYEYLLHILTHSLVFIYLLNQKLKLTLFNIFVIPYFLIFGIGFYFYVEEYPYDNFTSVRNLAALNISLCSIFIFLGKLIFQISFPSNKTSAKIIANAQRIINKWLLISLSIFVALVLVLALFVYGGLDAIKIITASRGQLNPLELKEIRFDSGVHGWVKPVFSYVNTSLSRLFPFLLIGYGTLHNNKYYKWFGYFIIILISLAEISTLHKSTFIYYLLQVIIFYALLKKWKLNTRFMIPVIAIIFTILMGYYAFLTSTDGIISIVGEISSRIVNEPHRCLNEYLKFWPEYQPHRYGMNIRVIHGLFSSQEFEPAFKTVIYQYTDPASPLLGTWPALFIADAWVDFSFFGVIIYSFVFGLMLELLDRYTRNNDDYLAYSLIASLFISVTIPLENSLITAFIGGGIITLPILVWMLIKKKKVRVKG